MTAKPDSQDYKADPELISSAVQMEQWLGQLETAATAKPEDANSRLWIVLVILVTPDSVGGLIITY